MHSHLTHLMELCPVCWQEVVDQWEHHSLAPQCVCTYVRNSSKGNAPLRCERRRQTFSVSRVWLSVVQWKVAGNNDMLRLCYVSSFLEWIISVCYWCEQLVLESVWVTYICECSGCVQVNCTRQSLLLRSSTPNVSATAADILWVTTARVPQSVRWMVISPQCMLTH